MNRKEIFFITFLFIFFSCVVFGQKKNAEKIYEYANKAVVRIFTSHEDGSQHGQASGVIYKKNNWIITNYHVLGDAEIINAEQNGKYIRLDSIVAFDPEKDVLILHISPDNEKDFFSSIPSLKTGSSEKLKVGQKVFAIGSPFGLENTITEGIISGLRTAFDTKQQFIQISAPVSQGSSGGAVMNTKGELIGISTMVMEGPTAQNLNFAIMIDDVFKVAEKKKTTISNEVVIKSADDYFKEGLTQLMQNNYFFSVESFRKSRDLSEKNQKPILEYYIGFSYHKAGLIDSAKFYYEKSKSQIYIRDTYIGLAAIAMQEKNYNTAVELYQKIIDTTPDYVDALIGQANAYYKLEDYSSALSVIQNLMTITKRNPDMYFLVGKITRKLNKEDDAISFFEMTIELSPRFAEAYLYLADIYYLKGQTDKVIEYQQKAYSLNPELRKIISLD